MVYGVVEAHLRDMPAPPTKACVASTTVRVCTGVNGKRFRFIVNRVLYVALLLLLSGDIELNPGPFDKGEMDYLKKLQDTIMSKLENIDTRITNSDTNIAEIKSKLEMTEGHIESVMKLVHEQATVIKNLTHQMRILQKKNIDLENRSRRMNLVFYGIDDNDQHETWEQSEALVKGICTAQLGYELTSVQRAHRVGRFNERKKRPIIVNFSSDKEKEVVLKKAKNLKGTQYSIEQDYSFETRTVRKKLWEYGKAKRADKKNLVKLKADKLIINGRAFTWDDEKEEVVALSKR